MDEAGRPRRRDSDEWRQRSPRLRRLLFELSAPDDSELSEQKLWLRSVAVESRLAAPVEGVTVVHYPRRLRKRDISREWIAPVEALAGEVVGISPERFQVVSLTVRLNKSDDVPENLVVSALKVETERLVASVRPTPDANRLLLGGSGVAGSIGAAPVLDRSFDAPTNGNKITAPQPSIPLVGVRAPAWEERWQLTPPVHSSGDRIRTSAAVDGVTIARRTMRVALDLFPTIEVEHSAGNQSDDGMTLFAEVELGEESERHLIAVGLSTAAGRTKSSSHLLDL